MGRLPTVQQVVWSLRSASATRPVGGLLKEMPLFFHPGRYVRVPLEATYMAADQAVPRVWQDVLEGGETPS